MTPCTPGTSMTLRGGVKAHNKCHWGSRCNCSWVLWSPRNGTPGQCLLLWYCHPPRLFRGHFPITL